MAKLGGDRMIEVLREVMRGERATPNESKAERDYRKKVTIEVKQIVEGGGIVDVPFEILDPSDW
jgi:hypothetical protein